MRPSFLSCKPCHRSNVVRPCLLHLCIHIYMCVYMYKKKNIIIIMIIFIIIIIITTAVIIIVCYILLYIVIYCYIVLLLLLLLLSLLVLLLFYCYYIYVLCPLSCCHCFIIFPNFPYFLICLKGLFSPRLGFTPKLFSEQKQHRANASQSPDPQSKTRTLRYAFGKNALNSLKTHTHTN